MFDSRRELGIFLFTTASRTALGPTHPPVQWVPGTLSLAVKRPGREADHSPPSSTEVECVNLYLYSPNTPSRRGTQPKKYGQFYHYTWEANSRWANQVIPRLLCNPKFHYHVHKNPPLVHILSQKNKTTPPRSVSLKSFKYYPPI
jgi:hypothetical protein